MNEAAEGIAAITKEFIEQLNLPKKIILLTGKGNNGGDAYTAGALLCKKGFSVLAISAFPSKNVLPSAVNAMTISLRAEEKSSRFRNTPKSRRLWSHPRWSCGTGFKGKRVGPLAKAITWANQSDLPILALYIPSGLNGTTGEVGSVAIEAVGTIFLGLPKIGFFFEKGWDHVGNLAGVDFGLPEKFIEEAKEEALLLDPASLHLPLMQRSRNKYEAGYVLGIAGSPPMPGAAALASAGVLRSGAGIVRLFSMPDTPSDQLLAEVIHEEYDLKKSKKNRSEQPLIL